MFVVFGSPLSIEPNSLSRVVNKSGSGACRIVFAIDLYLYLSSRSSWILTVNVGNKSSVHFFVKHKVTLTVATLLWTIPSCFFSFLASFFSAQESSYCPLIVVLHTLAPSLRMISLPWMLVCKVCLYLGCLRLLEGMLLKTLWKNHFVNTYVEYRHHKHQLWPILLIQLTVPLGKFLRTL